MMSGVLVGFFFQAEDGIRDLTVTGVQTCALPICANWRRTKSSAPRFRWAIARARSGRTALPSSSFSAPEQHASADRKSTRLNSSHSQISYAVFCLKKQRISVALDNTVFWLDIAVS